MLILSRMIYNYKGNQRRLVLANNVTEKHIAEEKLKESYEAIRTLTGHLQNVREEERLHISREIHDELGQLLTVLKMDVSWLNKKIEPENKVAKEKLSEILSMVDTTVKSVRRIASELRPSLLDDLGLYAAMEWHLEEFERRSGIIKELVIPETELLLPDALKIGIFRIFQESLTNVARHSGAKNVNVSLLQKDNQLILTIRDNGIGFEEEPMTTKKTLGLLGMKERSMMMGGQYNIIQCERRRHHRNRHHSIVKKTFVNLIRPMLKILIADDHAIVRKGLKQILVEEYPSVVIGEVADTEGLLTEIINDSWNIVICDMNMPGRSGLDALNQLKQVAPHVPVLIMSMYPEDQYALRAIKAGAAGYLEKETIHDNIIKAIQTVQLGKKFITPSVAEKLADAFNSNSNKQPHELLSDREFDVFKLLASGKSVSEIAGQLSLSTTTVSTYRSRILEKMGIRSNAELTRYALERKLI